MTDTDVKLELGICQMKLEHYIENDHIEGIQSVLTRLQRLIISCIMLNGSPTNTDEVYFSVIEERDICRDRLDELLTKYNLVGKL